MHKTFWMCAALAAAMALPAAPAAEGDAELSAETSEDEFRYAGVFPDGVGTVACISPASYPGNPKHRRGVELLEKAGLEVKVMPHAFARPEPGKKSAPLAYRLEDFYSAWNDPEVDMIVCIRGGGGSGELLENLDWSRLEKRPGLYFQGFSDITLILNTMLSQKAGHPYSGPMLSIRPVQATTMSACFVTAGMSAVLVWQTVTVAWRAMSRWSSGLPTIRIWKRGRRRTPFFSAYWTRCNAGYRPIRWPASRPCCKAPRLRQGKTRRCRTISTRRWTSSTGCKRKQGGGFSPPPCQTLFYSMRFK